MLEVHTNKSRFPTLQTLKVLKTIVALDILEYSVQAACHTIYFR